MAYDPNLFYTYKNYPWNAVTVPEGWQEGRNSKGEVRYRLTGTNESRSEHPSIYTTFAELSRLAPADLLRVRPWQVDWHSGSTVPIPKPTDHKSQMIYGLINWSGFSGNIINDPKLTKEVKERRLIELGREWTYKLNQQYADLGTKDMPVIVARKGGLKRNMLRKTGKKMTTTRGRNRNRHKNRKTRRMR